MTTNTAEHPIVLFIIVGIAFALIFVGPSFFLAGQYLPSTEQFYRDSQERANTLMEAKWAPAAWPGWITNGWWYTPVFPLVTHQYETARNAIVTAQSIHVELKALEAQGHEGAKQAYTDLTTTLDGARDALNIGEGILHRRFFVVSMFALFPVMILVVGLVVWVRRRMDQVAPKEAEMLTFSAKMMIVPQKLWFHPNMGPLSAVPDISAHLKKTGINDPISLKLAAIYAGVPDCPASIGHHGNIRGGLQLHLSLVLKKLDGIINDVHTEFHQMARWVALAHDIGKTLTYVRNPDGTWSSNGRPHDRLSASLLSSLDEVIALPQDHRWLLIRAVRYYHDHTDLPLDTPYICKKLIELVQRAEKIAEKEEATHLKDHVNIVAPYLDAAIDAAIKELNINRTKFGHSHGWLPNSIQAVFILEWRFREMVMSQLPTKIREELPIAHKGEKLSPLWPLIKEILVRRGWLLTQLNGKQAHDGFFNVRVDQNIFKLVIAIDPGKLPQDMVQRWQRAGRAPDLYLV